MTIAVDPADDWLTRLLLHFDRRWMPPEDGLAVDRDRRAGLQRISGSDHADHLTMLIDYYGDARPQLVAFARRLLGRHSEQAEDLLQDVMRKVCQKPPVLRDPDRIDALFHQALRNGAVTWGTRAGRELQHLTHDSEGVRELPDPAVAFEDVVLFHLVVARALSTLSPREREVIELVDLRRLTVREAADELGVSLGAAKNYRFVGLRRLREDPGVNALRGA
ncbi:sigma-70 family RNA polymerase sigma factor [Actinomycetospora endophytica]|uniref:Sigma-70 family RNA polymerase sigma factor n=1 Tax=Actinomycetospora endophytica TaxID=2291215 RepID=A0ABS8PD00_9PSEU|nr:sigma-70 family RNA polymerase sigma factor [Actinomycetospora endophytica]MCD2195296.1 sigma-70 family RNA polymerase sigma factor [Actinomycetospora endophytica]